MRFLAFLSSLFGPPPAIEAAVNAEWNCAFSASHAQAELERRGVRSRIDTVKIDGQEHAYVRADDWVIDNGRLCGKSRVCLARDALYGL